MKYVVIGCDTFHAYNFFLPFVCRLWRERIGYEPIVFLVGTPDEWGRGHSAIVLEALKSGAWRIEWMDHVPGVPSATVAQCVRHHAGALPDLEPSGILMTSDADLLPIRREFFHQHDPSKHEIALYNSTVYGDVDHWTNLHMSFTVDTLREVMGFETRDVRACMLKTFQYGHLDDLIRKKKEDSRDPGLWFFDERYPSAKIMASRFYPESVLKIQRDGGGCPKDQLSRSGPWPETYQADHYVDCHAHRPGWTDIYWLKIRPLIVQLMPGLSGWADAYRAAFWQVGPDRC